MDTRRAASRETDEAFARQLAEEADVEAQLEEAQKALGKHVAVETHRPIDPKREADIMASLDTPAYRRALADQAAGIQIGGKDGDSGQEKKQRTAQIVATSGYILTSLVPTQTVVSEILAEAPADATPEATEVPQQEPAAYPTPSTHRIFLPFGSRPRMPGDGTSSPTPKDTETPPPVPSNTATVVSTATYAPTATVGLPTQEATPTPERREIELNVDSILYLFVDRNSLWAKPGDIDLDNLKVEVIGKTVEGFALVKTDYGDLIVKPQQDFDMGTVPEVTSPRRRIVFADESSPIRMEAGLSDTKIQYLPVTWTEVGQNQSYTYTFSGGDRVRQNASDSP
ncbi:MAG: hypothetical protein UZ21_OP11001000640 [Microgenomates bacterium OLB22]|nr:MAG: hypothetical protein UZ21_OP11001000640 [Microgenomates bacterium OLB22]